MSGAAETIAAEARSESPLWAAALRAEPEREPGFASLAPERFALGLETIYEAYLVHYGRSRLFDPAEESERVLLGDYLYAHGLVRVAAAGGVEAVATMAELISRCASLRAAGEAGDGRGVGRRRQVAWRRPQRRRDRRVPPPPRRPNGLRFFPSDPRTGREEYDRQPQETTASQSSVVPNPEMRAHEPGWIEPNRSPTSALGSDGKTRIDRRRRLRCRIRTTLTTAKRSSPGSASPRPGGDRRHRPDRTRPVRRPLLRATRSKTRWRGNWLGSAS